MNEMKVMLTFDELNILRGLFCPDEWMPTAFTVDIDGHYRIGISSNQDLTVTAERAFMMGIACRIIKTTVFELYDQVMEVLGILADLAPLHFSYCQFAPGTVLATILAKTICPIASYIRYVPVCQSVNDIKLSPPDYLCLQFLVKCANLHVYAFTGPVSKVHQNFFGTNVDDVDDASKIGQAVRSIRLAASQRSARTESSFCAADWSGKAQLPLLDRYDRWYILIDKYVDDTITFTYVDRLFMNSETEDLHLSPTTIIDAALEYKDNLLRSSIKGGSAYVPYCLETPNDVIVGRSLMYLVQNYVSALPHTIHRFHMYGKSDSETDVNAEQVLLNTIAAEIEGQASVDYDTVRPKTYYELIACYSVVMSCVQTYEDKVFEYLPKLFGVRRRPREEDENK